MRVDLRSIVPQQDTHTAGVKQQASSVLTSLCRLSSVGLCVNHHRWPFTWWVRYRLTACGKDGLCKTCGLDVWLDHTTNSLIALSKIKHRKTVWMNCLTYSRGQVSRWFDDFLKQRCVKMALINIILFLMLMVWWVIGSILHGGPIELFLIPASVLLSVRWCI